MADAQASSFLAKHGAALIEHGYDIIPIKRGTKSPGYDGWQNTRADSSQLRQWLANGHAKDGVGILTRNTPGVDIDVRDEAMAKAMEDWIVSNYDFAPVRIGLAPKRLLLFRTDSPFTKVNSRVFVDEWGEQHKVEILGDGQQFVAHAIHPDTNQPYRWIDGRSPDTISVDDLPTITEDQAYEIVAEFERRAVEAGWEIKSKSLKPASGGALPRPGRRDHDDPFAADAAKTDISDALLRAKLLLVPGAEDYDTWLQVGMALFHQFDGGDHGLELWHEWSEQADNYDENALNEKWRTFDISNKGRAPVTARLILKLAKEGEDAVVNDSLESTKKLIDEAKDVAEMRRLAEKIQKMEMPIDVRQTIIPIFQKKWNEVTGGKLSLPDARKLLRYLAPEVKVPRWARNFVFVMHDDTFYNWETGESCTTRGFNAANDRFAMTKADVMAGNSRPEKSAADLALNQYQIPIVRNRMYMPLADPGVFEMNGSTYVNTYSDRNAARAAEAETAADKSNLEIVKKHFEHLTEDEREREILISYLSYCVKHPGKKINWAIVIQGSEGDGKSVIGVMMAAVLGIDNVRMIDAATMDGQFNGWAEGSCMTFVEEVKMHGHNRYDVVNRVKPLITNPVIDIHRKGKDNYNAPNTTNYILFTNFRDALPLKDGDSRYFIIFSRFGDAKYLAQFNAENPFYFDRLFKAVTESAGVIKQWLLDYDAHDEFSPKKRAPQSFGKRYMVQMEKSEEAELLDQLLEDGDRRDISETLLSVTALAEEFYQAHAELPEKRGLAKLLNDAGFTSLGQVRLGGKDEPRMRFWSKTPERFIVDGKPHAPSIRAYLQGGDDEL
jgi:hypothetical protein